MSPDWSSTRPSMSNRLKTLASSGEKSLSNSTGRHQLIQTSSCSTTSILEKDPSPSSGWRAPQRTFAIIFWIGILNGVMATRLHSIGRYSLTKAAFWSVEYRSGGTRSLCYKRGRGVLRGFLYYFPQPHIVLGKVDGIE